MADKTERALLAGIYCTELADFSNSTDETMDELEELLKTAGGECAAKAIQRRKTPDPGTYIGEGKIAEFIQIIKNEEIDLVVFDNELSPSQTRNLEKELSCRVIDRNTLILDIFADRANTAEGKLQVELAQYKYLLPRLSGMWGHLVRQTSSGGRSPIGTRGPGETQLETDRRHIRHKISVLEQKISDIRKNRSVQRDKRLKSGVPTACLIGYTNAGKSTLLNAMSGAGVHTADRLFDTLDPTTRTIRMEDGRTLIVSDTVGFIRKLPHLLIDAFKATLEELVYADVLVHVIDPSNPQWREQAQVVDGIIDELGVSDTPKITLFNKIDRLTEEDLPRQTGALYCSALKRIGVERLCEQILNAAGRDKIESEFLIPYSAGGVLDALYSKARVSGTEYAENGIKVNALCSEHIRGAFKEYLVK